jgi:hypothetical protein
MPCNDKEWKPNLDTKTATMANFHHRSISGLTCPFNPDGVFGAQGSEIQCFHRLATHPQYFEGLHLEKVLPNATTALTITAANGKLPTIHRI